MDGLGNDSAENSVKRLTCGNGYVKLDLERSTF